MNLKIVFYYMGWVLNIEAVLMLLPCVISVIYGDGILKFFLSPMVLCLLIGWITTHKKPKDTVFYAREGFLVVSLTWVMLSFFGALPFWLSGQIPSLTDALFETISGFTTTGASILINVEGLSRGMLFWRSFTHWLGGMGILVFLLAVVPMGKGGYSFNLLRAESPGPSVTKLVPKTRESATILYRLYILLTVLCVGFLLLGECPFLTVSAPPWAPPAPEGLASRTIPWRGIPPIFRTCVPCLWLFSA